MKPIQNDIDLLFTRVLPVSILTTLHHQKECYPAFLMKEIAKEHQSKATYSHVVKLLIKYEKLGYVKSKKRGRMKFYSITEKGDVLAKEFIKLMGVA